MVRKVSMTKAKQKVKMNKNSKILKNKKGILKKRSDSMRSSKEEKSRLLDFFNDLVRSGRFEERISKP